MGTSSLKEELSRNKELTIGFRGRKTGRRYKTIVWFVYEDDRIHLLPVSGSDTNWYRNILKNPSMSISVSGKSIEILAKSVIDKRAVENTIEKFKSKYGADDINKWYTQLDVAVEIALPS